MLFNNAGIGGGGSMVTNSRDEWERTFNICWGGVYNCTRAFLPMLQNAEESHIGLVTVGDLVAKPLTCVRSATSAMCVVILRSWRRAVCVGQCR